MNDIVDSCHANCSGHGECMNGSCYCLIQFEGDECQRIHFSYHVAFSSIFFLLALTSLIQLVMCIHAEYLRMKKNPSIIKACRVTTQKFLYFLVFLAAVLRGAYFAAPVIPKSNLLLLIQFSLSTFCFSDHWFGMVHQFDECLLPRGPHRCLLNRLLLG